MSNSSEKPMLKPAIIVGMGGTGNQTVRRLKQLVQEQYGNTPSLLNFLVVDSDDATFNDQNWAPLPPLTEHERLPLYDAQVAFSDVRENPGAYPEIHEWLLPSLDIGLLDRQQGAGQVRMLGRLALYKSFDFFGRRIEYFFNRCQQIQTLLSAMEQYDFNIETDPVVYLVSSACGGQGAGTFVDAAVALRALAANRFPRLNLIGVLTLPSVYQEKIPRENWGRVCANAHAAMKEVDYLMHSADRSKMRFRFPAPIERTVTPQGPLFDLCYLVDNRHQRGALNRPEEVYDQIATQLFLEIGTPFGARSDSVRVNLNTVAGLELDRVHRTGRRYSGFGNHTISFNREKIVHLASLKSAYTTIHDTLLGQSLTTSEMDIAVGEFIARHRLDESQTDDLVNTLITTREVSREQLPASFAQDRPDHATLAGDLWARFDVFWLRLAPEAQTRMERRARAILDGADEQRGVLGDIEEAVDLRLRESGAAAASDLTEALLSRLSAFDELMRAEQQEQQMQAQRLRQEAETARNELLNIARQLDQLQDEEERANLFSRAWQRLGLVITFGLWRPGVAESENRARQFHELSLRAQNQRDLFLSRYNQAVERRLAAAAREVAAGLYAEAVAQLAGLKDQLERLKRSLADSGRLLREELDKLSTEVKRSPFIGENTMRRDVTADYVEQYHRMHVTRATAEVSQWLLPPGQHALAALADRHDREQIRQRFYDLYAEDILRRRDRDSLSEMINRFHTHNYGGSLTERIGEGLQFCLPFWDIRVPGNQFATEVLLVGLEQDNLAVQNYLATHAAGQRGQVFPQVVPTGQDSVILISRIAHGASYYWHAQDETFFREYRQTLEAAPYPVHLRQEWTRLPEPIPDPSKYERRVFALGLAYEFIAVRGASYYLDPERRYTLVGTARQASPDWKTIPLLEAGAISGDPQPPAQPSAADMIDDDQRTEAMQKFVDTDDQANAVRAPLMALFNQQGRDSMRQQIERYCREALEPAIRDLAADSPIRHQLEVEQSELEEVTAELKSVTGLKLAR